MQAAISDLSPAPGDVMDCLVSGCSATLSGGYECKQAGDCTGAAGWAHSGGR